MLRSKAPAVALAAARDKPQYGSTSISNQYGFDEHQASSLLLTRSDITDAYISWWIARFISTIDIVAQYLGIAYVSCHSLRQGKAER